jgi:hypothetical protein
VGTRRDSSSTCGNSNKTTEHQREQNRLVKHSEGKMKGENAETRQGGNINVHIA